MRAAIGALLLCALALAAAAAETSALSDRAAAKARAAKVLASSSYQTSMPEKDVAFSLPIPPAFAEIVTFLLYALVALAVVAIAVIVAQAVTRSGMFGGQGPTATSAGTIAPGSRHRGPTIVDADDLAAAGRYRDAVHLLLLVAIGEAARATDARFPPSTTSRELTRILPLRDHPKARFGELVASVEQSLFGGGEVAAGDYALCRERCLAVSGPSL